MQGHQVVFADVQHRRAVGEQVLDFNPAMLVYLVAHAVRKASKTV